MEKARNLDNKSSGARVYAITSGKGGVGKTSIAINLAIVLNKAGLKVLLIDADMGLANIDLMTGVSALHTIEEVIEGKASIFDALADGPEGLTILLAGSGLGCINDMGEERAKKFKNELLKLENAFDMIFIDTGAGISANVVDFIFMADEVVVIMTSEPTAFADAYAIVKVVTMEKPSMDVSEYHGSIVQDRAVADAVMRQIPLALYAGKSSSMQFIRKIARNMLGIEKTKQRTIFNR